MGNLLSRLMGLFPSANQNDHDWEGHDANNQEQNVGYANIMPILEDWSDNESEQSCDESCTCGNPLGNPLRVQLPSN